MYANKHTEVGFPAVPCISLMLPRGGVTVGRTPTYAEFEWGAGTCDIQLWRSLEHGLLATSNQRLAQGEGSCCVR